MGAFRDLTGQKFGRLTVIKQFGRDKKGGILWRCVCDCGEERHVLAYNLTKGITKSCGCFQKDAASVANKTHGLSKTQEYRHWLHVIKRCCNPNDKNYPKYSKLGMSSIYRDSFEEFFKEIGPIPNDTQRWSVGRKDNEIGYYPGNIQWETDEQQARNHRMQSNNTSGFVGVSRNNVMESWIAAWRDETGKHTRSFSEKRYGDLAFHLAVACREYAMDNNKLEWGEKHGKPFEVIQQPEDDE